MVPFLGTPCIYFSIFGCWLCPKNLAFARKILALPESGSAWLCSPQPLARTLMVLQFTQWNDYVFIYYVYRWFTVIPRRYGVYHQRQGQRPQPRKLCTEGERWLVVQELQSGKPQWRLWRWNRQLHQWIGHELDHLEGSLAEKGRNEDQAVSW